jgi:hypothetical protein
VLRIWKLQIKSCYFITVWTNVVANYCLIRRIPMFRKMHFLLKWYTEWFFFKRECNLRNVSPNKPPIQRALGAVSPGVKRPGREAGHLSSTAKVKNGGAIAPLPHTFSWCDAQLIERRDNFTYIKSYRLARIVWIQIYFTLFLRTGQASPGIRHAPQFDKPWNMLLQAYWR